MSEITWMGRAGTAMAILLTASACTFQERTDRIREESTPSSRRDVIQPGGTSGSAPFSSAIRSGGLIFLSGAIGTAPGVGLVEGGIQPETRQALNNISDVLELSEATLADVLKCTVFLADIADFAAMNEVYAQYFPSDPPARTTVAAGGIAAGGRVEIECIAAAPTGS